TGRFHLGRFERSDAISLCRRSRQSTGLREIRSSFHTGPARAERYCRQGEKTRKPATLCGELASQPIGALALAILGYRTLSLTPSAVGPVKALLLELDCRKAEATLLPCLEQSVGSVSIRHKLERFAAAEGLQL